MLLWLDNHLSPKICVMLKTRFGVDATPVRALGLADADDEAIFRAARSAGACVITKDADWVVLLQRHGPPPQVVWLRFGNTSTSVVVALFERRFAAIKELLAAGEPLIEVLAAD